MHSCDVDHEALSPYTRDSSSGPTQTFTQQKHFAQRLRGVLSRINARIREALITDDLLGLRDEALVDDVPEQAFDYPTARRRIRGFLQWLRGQLDENYLTVVGPDRNQFVTAAYAAGIREAHSQLSNLNVGFQREDVDDLLGAPIHSASLRTLYTRTYENLQSVRDDVATEVRDALVDGFRDGESPTKIARAMTERVDKVGKYRSTLIARSEVINAHSEGTLTRVEEINRDSSETVAVGHGEWDAAVSQPNTCAFCRALNGTDLRVSEMRGTTVQFRGQLYRLKPPAHPNGRCRIGVRVGGTIDTPLSERLPAEVTLIT